MFGNSFGYRVARETAIGSNSVVAAEKMAETVIADVRKGWKISINFTECKDNISSSVSVAYWTTLIEKLRQSPFTEKYINRCLKGDLDSLIRISGMSRQSMAHLAKALADIEKKNQPARKKIRK